MPSSTFTVATRGKGDNYNLRNLNLVSLQMFNGFPESSNYRHHVRLKNQENEEFYKKQTITLVEIPKFLKGGYGHFLLGIAPTAAYVSNLAKLSFFPNKFNSSRIRTFAYCGMRIRIFMK